MDLEPNFILADTYNPLPGLAESSFYFGTTSILYWSPASLSDAGMSGSVATPFARQF
jgi:hypothetical protein